MPFPSDFAGAGQVVVRWLRTDVLPDGWLERARLVLDEDEADRADRFHFDRDRRDYIAAHALTRSLLGSLTGRAPGSLRFTKGGRGKPALAHPVPLAFNLSHAHGLVACAATPEGEIGLDVERLDRPISPGLPEHCLAPAELAWFNSLPDERRQPAFLRFWTLKESLIKATGEGLARSLQSFAFTLAPIDVAFTDPAERRERWRFHQAEPFAGYSLAAAVRRDEAGPNTFDVAAALPEDLVAG